MADRKKPPQKKENILDLSKYLNKQTRVKFSGGREGNLPNELTNRVQYCIFIKVVGVLKGYDGLLNLVLDSTQEYLQSNSKKILLTYWGNR